MSKHVLNSAHENESEVALVTLTERTVRGALKVTVDTSKSIVRAGEAFSVFVTIENPFDIPIIVQSTETHLPIELRDLFGEYLRRNATKGEREKQLAGLPLNEWLKKRLSLLWADLSGYFMRKPTPQIAQAYSTKESALVSPREFISQIISAHSSSEVSNVTQVSSDILITLDPSIPPAEFQKYIHAISAVQRTPPSSDEVILRPGSSVVKQFLFKTRRWLLFIPFRHRMVIQVSYIADKAFNYDTVPYDLDIRASLGSTILGSAIGGFVGSLARSQDLSSWFTAPMLFPALVSAILSIITVVAFARKSDAQPLVAVEDFLGGLLLGFVVGYTGNALFQQTMQGMGVVPTNTP